MPVAGAERLRWRVRMHAGVGAKYVDVAAEHLESLVDAGGERLRVAQVGFHSVYIGSADLMPRNRHSASRLASVMSVAPASAASRAATATRTCHVGRVSRSS